MFVCFNSTTEKAWKVAMNKSPGKDRKIAIRYGSEQGQHYFKN